MKKEKSTVKEQEEKDKVINNSETEGKNAPTIEEILIIVEAKCNEYKDIAQRVQAEFENYRKRTQEEIKNSLSEGANSVIREILQIDDNFDRALGQIKEGSDKEGILLIKKQIKAMLERYDVKEIEANNATFDPTLHNAVMQVEEEGKENQVIEVLQKGYMRSGKVLRYAMVKVAK